MTTRNLNTSLGVERSRTSRGVIVDRHFQISPTLFLASPRVPLPF